MKRIAPLALALSVLSVTACADSSTAPDARVVSASDAESASATSLEHSSAPFKTWHQGFNHGTEGWYGAETPGQLGWCGEIRHVSRGGAVAPSAGSGHATVAQGPCNAHWDAEYSGPGATLVGAPWAPGQGFAALGGAWKGSGYTMELDIYLDPAWDAVPPEEGTYVFELNPAGSGTVLAYSVSFFNAATEAFNYLWVPVRSGDGALLVGEGEHEITAAGWYTFRHVFRDANGWLAVDFEIAHARGGLIGAEAVTTSYFAGLPLSSVAAADVLSGYAWFTSIATGLELPIDEYRVRRGR